MGKRVLLVDDDEKLRRLIKEYLEGYEFRVLTLPDGEAVMNSIRKESPEIVILDVMLPKKDGLEVLKEIRAASRIPVIMLTAKGEEADRVVGLELGADDYLPKPFSPRELLARIKAVLRRLETGMKAAGEESEGLRLEAGNLVLDKARQTLVMEGKEIALSSTEYRVLKVLMENPNRVLSRDQIMTMAQGKDFMAFDRSIDVHISKLRAKLEPDPRSPKRIKTIWGSGYMFVHST
ncbi:MAG: response regulator transcription factor [Desulfobacterota bacterium]|jgi:two-component system phosphate regulon response regulator OmpR|nr:response regulator transcription factor [Thermodesulfobacteriota bacterium]